MKKSIITHVSTTPEGVNIKLNQATRMRGLNVKGTDFFVSWDKIGKMLFENYTDAETVADLRRLREIA
jgi:hypothetical protein